MLPPDITDKQQKTIRNITNKCSKTSDMNMSPSALYTHGTIKLHEFKQPLIAGAVRSKAGSVVCVYAAALRGADPQSRESYRLSVRLNSRINGHRPQSLIR
jgi:hypothetical protein